MSQATCQLNGTLVTPCLSLLETSEDHHKKGLVVYDIVSPESNFKPIRNIYAIKNGKHTRRGLLANYCPFCGVKIVSTQQPVEEKPLMNSTNHPQTTERDILSKILIEGQNQIHDLKDGRATSEQITERMFVSLDYWEPKLESAINQHIVQVLEGLKESVTELDDQHTVKFGTVIKWSDVMDTINEAIDKYKEK